MIQVVFPTLSPGEKRLFIFPFGVAVPVGVTISSAVVVATTYSGTDASPNDIVSGSDSTVGLTVTQLIDASLGVVGTTYFLLCTATLSDGQLVQCGGYVAILPAAVPGVV